MHAHYKAHTCRLPVADMNYSIIYSQNDHISITYTFTIGKEEKEEKKKKRNIPYACAFLQFCQVMPVRTVPYELLR